MLAMPVDTVITSAAAGTWQATPDELAGALRGPVLAHIDDLGVIEVSGADAISFLQGQLTNDTAGLDAQRVQLTGYCTAKGRLIAVFDQWREGDVICLQLPQEILAPVMKKLGMFVLRAKAKLTDASVRWVTLGLLGPGSEALVSQVFGAAPLAGASRVVDSVRITRLADGARAQERFMLRTSVDHAPALSDRLGAALKVDGGVWWWSQIDAAQPTVVAATQEAFVPQTINLEVLGGVNFKKGCYPGQEVVARSQYRGNLRRRMSVAHSTQPTQAGADVFALDETEPVGQIVLAASAPGGGMDVLLQCPMDRPLIEQALLRIGGPQGAPLDVRPLPYAIVDVTA
jgi:tRNA-modifying protein YgfZ